MSDYPARAVVLVALALLLATPAWARPEGELDADAFVRVLDELAEDIASATPETAAARRADLPPAWRVRAGGDVVDVSARWLSTALHQAGRDAAAWPAHRRQIAARIAAMRAEAVAFRDGEGAGPDPRAGAVLRDVLARPEFQRSAASIWFERMRDRVVGWMATVLQWMGARGPNRRTAAIVLAWLVGLGALAAFTWWLLATIARANEAAQLGLADVRQGRRTSGSWARLALAAHAAGDAREATRLGYHAAVCRIEEEGAWTTDEARTPREYLQLLPAAHRRRSLVADITARFERICYGAAPATGDDSRRVLASLKDLGCLASDQPI